MPFFPRGPPRCAVAGPAHATAPVGLDQRPLQLFGIQPPGHVQKRPLDCRYRDCPLLCDLCLVGANGFGASGYRTSSGEVTAGAAKHLDRSPRAPRTPQMPLRCYATAPLRVQRRGPPPIQLSLPTNTLDAQRQKHLETTGNQLPSFDPPLVEPLSDSHLRSTAAAQLPRAGARPAPAQSESPPDPSPRTLPADQPELHQLLHLPDRKFDAVRVGSAVDMRGRSRTWTRGWCGECHGLRAAM